VSCFQNAEVDVEIVIVDGLDELLPNGIRMDGKREIDGAIGAHL
jgi:hypothetical protein